MKRTLLILLAFMALVQMVSAQDIIENIRKHYNDTKAWVDGMADPYQFPLDMNDDKPNAPAYYLVNIEENYPGTGMHHEKVYIYHVDVEGSEEGEVFPPQRIDFAKTNYNFAAREFYEEYLYDKKGRVEFIYASQCVDEVFQDTEFRFYFNAGKLIKVVIKTRANHEDEYKETYSGTKVPEQYKQEYNSLVNKASHVKKMFDAVYGYQYNNL